MVALGLALQADVEFLRRNRALIEDDAELFEINPETLWQSGAEPSPLWDLFAELVSRARRPVVGHGILFSLGSAIPPPRRSRWLQALRRDQAVFGYRWYSEHLGFADAGDRHVALPLPLPVCDEAAAVVATALAALRDVFPRVGFENNVGYLALGDPGDEPALFRRLCRETGAGLVLDLHNAWVTATNFDLNLGTWVSACPLDAVMEIHLSGGSASDPAWLPSRRVLRLDSHDGSVPEPVWRAFESVLPRCPNLEAVVLEWMPDDMDDAAAAALRADFMRARSVLR